MKLIFTLTLFVINSNLFAQKDTRLLSRPLRTDSTIINVQILNPASNEKVEVCFTCCYHWVKGGIIKLTFGGYEGQLLHGGYSEFYLNGDLKTKGRFKKGLKHKEWRSWYNGGELRTIQSWKNGELNGISLLYNSSGQIQEELNYKNGLLQGKQNYYLDSLPRVEIYKNGVKKDLKKTDQSQPQNKKVRRKENNNSKDTQKSSEVPNEDAEIKNEKEAEKGTKALKREKVEKGKSNNKL